jgi:hypothetical protein
VEDLLQRFFGDLLGRLEGPLHFRLILQPLMAMILAVKDGVKDAHAGRPPYFWELFTSPGRRGQLIRNGWKSVGKIFVVAVVLDTVYQMIALHWLYPGEAALVAIILAILPYLILRGAANRLTSGRGKEAQG